MLPSQQQWDVGLPKGPELQQVGAAGVEDRVDFLPCHHPYAAGTAIQGTSMTICLGFCPREAYRHRAPWSLNHPTLMQWGGVTRQPEGLGSVQPPAPDLLALTL